MRDISLTRFDGGYFTEVPSTALQPNELLRADNCYFDDMLRARKGYTKVGYPENPYSPDWPDYFLGVLYDRFDNLSWEAKFGSSSEYVFLVASYDGGISRELRFHFYGFHTDALYPSWEGTSYMPYEIDMQEAISISTTQRVSMARLGDYVVACSTSGAFDPIVIYYNQDSLSWVAHYLYKLDGRTRDRKFWNVYRYDENAPQPITSEELNINGVEDTLIDESSGLGFAIYSDYTFDTIVITDESGSPYLDDEVELQVVKANSYGNPSFTITSFTSTSVDLGFGTYKHTIVFDWDENVIPEDGRYAVLFKGNTGSAYSLGSVRELRHDKYLTNVVFNNEKPQFVVNHDSRICFSFGNTLNLSRYNKITDWSVSDVEYFQDGGNEIKSLLSTPMGLLVFKPSATYLLSGNSYQNWYKEKILNVGTKAPFSPIFVNGSVYFFDSGGITMYDGDRSYVISKHIDSDIKALSNDSNFSNDQVISAYYRGRIYFLMNVYNNEQAFVFDPDTLRDADDGEKRVSWYRYTNYKFAYFVVGPGSRLIDLENTEIFFGFRQQDFGDNSLLLYYLESGTHDDQDTVTMLFQTPYLRFSTGGSRKRLGRLKLELSTYSSYTITLLSDEGQYSASKETVITGDLLVQTEELTLPYQLDGKSISIRISGQEYYSNAFILPGALGYWEFENNGDDSTGNGNHLGLSPQYEPGVLGMAAVSSPLSINVGYPLCPPNPFSVILWFKISMNQFGYIFSTLNDAGNYGCEIFMNGTYIGIDFSITGPSGSALVRSEFSVTEEKWHQAALVFTGADLIGYFDGELVGSQPYTGGNFSNSLQYFGGNGSGIRDFIGSIDEAAIFDRALTESEIQNYFDAISNYEPQIYSPGVLAVHMAYQKRGY